MLVRFASASVSESERAAEILRAAERLERARNYLNSACAPQNQSALGFKRSG